MKIFIVIVLISVIICFAILAHIIILIGRKNAAKSKPIIIDVTDDNLADVQKIMEAKWQHEENATLCKKNITRYVLFAITD